MPVNLANLNLNNKTVLLRADYNVPIRDQQVVDDTRIVASLPTLRTILSADQAKIILLSHLGRPEPGNYDEQFTLAPVADCLAQHLGMSVPLIRDWLDGVDFAGHQLVLCENVRFQKGETSDDDELARKMARLCDVYVNDAFATAHRSHASTHGVARYANMACAGTLLLNELETLGKVLRDPVRPLVAVVGGAKVFDKIDLLSSLSEKVDCLLVGGAVANTFLAATGCPMEDSLHETGLVPVARQIIERAGDSGLTLELPVDVVCAERPDDTAAASTRPPGQLVAKERILDIGPETVNVFRRRLAGAGTIIWNGPMGVFEIGQFASGTGAVGQAIADSRAFSVAGGGDTLAVISHYRLQEHIGYVSTGGGAFLAFLEDKTLPVVVMLDEVARVWEAMEQARDL